MQIPPSRTLLFIETCVVPGSWACRGPLCRTLLFIETERHLNFESDHSILRRTLLFIETRYAALYPDKALIVFVALFFSLKPITSWT